MTNPFILKIRADYLELTVCVVMRLILEGDDDLICIHDYL
jgi:hypothetical protein